MKEINWDEAPEGFPVWIESFNSDEKSDWHYETDYYYTDRSGRSWSKTEDGLYRVHHKPDCTPTQVAQESIESPPLVQKTTHKNDDSSGGVSQPMPDKNAWFERGELPEVGTKCIFTGVDEDVKGVIVAHVEYCGDYQAIVQCKGDWWSGEVGEFRPIKTAEEMEAEGREKAIEELRSSVGEKLGIKPCYALQWRVAEAIYDLGYRRMEE